MWINRHHPYYAAEGGSGGAGDGGNNAGVGGAGGAGNGGGAPPWHQGLDADTIGLLQNRGVKLDDPKEAIGNLSKAYREATSKLGVPPDQLVRLPKADAPEADIKAFWQRLGAPPDPKGYDFADVKYADGTALDAADADNLRQLFTGLNLPKTTADAIAKGFVKMADSEEAQAKTLREGNLAVEKADLAKSWGNNHDRFKFQAESARVALQQALQLDNAKMAEVVNTIENAYGYSNTMKMFHLISTKIGEGKFIDSGGNNAGNALTREQAVSRKADLYADKAWVGRYMAGDVQARAEMTNLNRIITGDFESAA